MSTTIAETLEGVEEHQPECLTIPQTTTNGPAAEVCGALKRLEQACLNRPAIGEELGSVYISGHRKCESEMTWNDLNNIADLVTAKGVYVESIPCDGPVTLKTTIKSVHGDYLPLYGRSRLCGHKRKDGSVYEECETCYFDRRHVNRMRIAHNQAVATRGKPDPIDVGVKFCKLCGKKECRRFGGKYSMNLGPSGVRVPAWGNCSRSSRYVVSPMALTAQAILGKFSNGADFCEAIYPCGACGGLFLQDCCEDCVVEVSQHSRTRRILECINCHSIFVKGLNAYMPMDFEWQDVACQCEVPHTGTQMEALIPRVWRKAPVVVFKTTLIESEMYTRGDWPTKHHGRLVRLFGKGFYCYPGATLIGIEKPDWLLNLEGTVRALIIDQGYTPDIGNFEMCVQNWYGPGGNNNIPWHSDDEEEIDQGKPIISLSFGSTCTFAMKRRDNVGKTVTVTLKSGDIALMRQGAQKQWRHCTMDTQGPRLNFTWRANVSQTQTQECNRESSVGKGYRQDKEGRSAAYKNASEISLEGSDREREDRNGDGFTDLEREAYGISLRRGYKKADGNSNVGTPAGGCRRKDTNPLVLYPESRSGPEGPVGADGSKPTLGRGSQSYAVGGTRRNTRESDGMDARKETPRCLDREQAENRGADGGTEAGACALGADASDVYKAETDYTSAEVVRRTKLPKGRRGVTPDGIQSGNGPPMGRGSGTGQTGLGGQRDFINSDVQLVRETAKPEDDGGSVTIMSKEERQALEKEEAKERALNEMWTESLAKVLPGDWEEQLLAYLRVSHDGLPFNISTKRMLVQKSMDWLKQFSNGSKFGMTNECVTAITRIVEAVCSRPEVQDVMLANTWQKAESINRVNDFYTRGVIRTNVLHPWLAAVLVGALSIVGACTWYNQVEMFSYHPEGFYPKGTTKMFDRQNLWSAVKAGMLMPVRSASYELYFQLPLLGIYYLGYFLLGCVGIVITWRCLKLIGLLFEKVRRQRHRHAVVQRVNPINPFEEDPDGPGLERVPEEVNFPALDFGSLFVCSNFLKFIVFLLVFCSCLFEFVKYSEGIVERGIHDERFPLWGFVDRFTVADHMGYEWIEYGRVGGVENAPIASIFGIFIASFVMSLTFVISLNVTLEKSIKRGN